jgi:hypothetical protein
VVALSRAVLMRRTMATDLEAVGRDLDIARGLGRAEARQADQRAVDDRSRGLTAATLGEVQRPADDDQVGRCSGSR